MTTKCRLRFRRAGNRPPVRRFRKTSLQWIFKGWYWQRSVRGARKDVPRTARKQDARADTRFPRSAVPRSACSASKRKYVLFGLHSSRHGFVPADHHLTRCFSNNAGTASSSLSWREIELRWAQNLWQFEGTRGWLRFGNFSGRGWLRFSKSEPQFDRNGVVEVFL